MNRLILTDKPLSEMSQDEALDCCAERTAMRGLAEFAASSLIDDFDGREIVELRRQLEIAVRIALRESLRSHAVLGG